MLTDQREEVRDQYNRYPYPHFSWLAKVNPVAVCHGSFEAGSALTQRKIESHKEKRIALLGCGTFEPYAMGSVHSKTEVDAVDISEKSLSLAKRRCFFRKIKNVNFLKNDLISFCNQHESQYDFINCFGVLHHLSQPVQGFKALARALNSQGFARIMVYSKTQRRRTQLIQNAAKILNLTPKQFGAPWKVKALLRALPPAHPLKLSQILNSELNSRHGTIDSLLHSCEKAFGLEELRTLLKEGGLYIHQWDFSQNLLKLLADADGATLMEKLYFLECFDQWPGPYTFWVSKNPSPIENPLFYRTNPHLLGHLTASLPSTVLKTQLHLSIDEMAILQHGFNNLIPHTEKAITNLISSRFLLGVDQ